MTGESRSRKVTWLELFFDLIFVAAVAQVGEPLRHDYSLAGGAHYAALFVLIWSAWTGQALFVTRFGADDLVQRGLTLLQVFAAAAMAANAADSDDSRSVAGFIAAYAGMRFILVVQYLRAGRIARGREIARNYCIIHGLAASLWLVSAVVPAPARYALWVPAFVIDISAPWFGRRHHLTVPPHAAHLPERFGLFTLILLGEAVIAVMHGMESQEHWSVPAATAAFASLVVPFIIWWWYFDGASAAAEHRVRSHGDAIRFQVWYYAHLPLCLGIAMAGIGLQQIVRLADGATLPREYVGVLAASVTSVTAALMLIGGARRRIPGGRIALYAVFSIGSLGLVSVDAAPAMIAAAAAAFVTLQFVVVVGPGAAPRETSWRIRQEDDHEPERRAARWVRAVG